MHRREQGFSHILVFLLFVIVLGAIGFAGWYVETRQANNIQSTNIPSDSTPTGASHPTTGPSISAAKVISNLSDGLKTQFPTNVVNGPAPAISLLASGTVANDPLWEPVGYDFYTYPSTNANVSYLIWPRNAVPGSGHAAPSDEDVATLQAFIDTTLTGFGFDKLPATSATVIVQEGVTVYVGRDALCRQDEQSTASGNENFGLTCADYSSFLASAATLQPFAQAYYTAHSQYRGKASLANPVIQDSSTVGYKVADVVISDAHSEFYEKNEQWHYVGSTQSGQLNCKEYANQDARLAFKGTDCFTDSGEQSTVQ